MKGLLIKDFKLLLKQYNIFILLIPLFIFIPKSISIVFVYNMIFSIGIITNDEFTKWNVMEKYMPLKPKDIVLSKYLFVYFFTLAEIILIAVSYLLNKYVFSQSISLYDAATTLFLTLIMAAFLFPLIIFFGSSKAKVVIGIIIGFFTCFGIIMLSALEENNPFTDTVFNIIDLLENHYILAAVTITLILNILSILLSIKLYKSRRYKI